jgi:pSer/pThr/pTyr-binding forkhead associated (FHA) protein
MEVELTEIDSSSPQRRFVLDKLPVMIGQSPDASVRLDDQWVSRQHCEINAVKGTLVVRDLGSILGTFVNGLNVTTAQLMPGDKLTIGETCFQVDYERPRIV